MIVLYSLYDPLIGFYDVLTRGSKYLEIVDYRIPILKKDRQKLMLLKLFFNIRALRGGLNITLYCL